MLGAMQYLIPLLERPHPVLGTLLGGMRLDGDAAPVALDAINPVLLAALLNCVIYHALNMAQPALGCIAGTIGGA